MPNQSEKCNKPYRELELHGSELNVNPERSSRCSRNFGNNVERSLELSSIVVIPDGILFMHNMHITNIKRSKLLEYTSYSNVSLQYH